jgi:hypothetical protein
VHTVVETSVYLREASKLLSDAERERVVSTIAKDPEIGDVIAGTGGFRKIRIALQGGGKSGGSRVIYYFCDETMPVFLMQIYAKNEKANLSAAPEKPAEEAVGGVQTQTQEVGDGEDVRRS